MNFSLHFLEKTEINEKEAGFLNNSQFGSLNSTEMSYWNKPKLRHFESICGVRFAHQEKH